MEQTLDICSRMGLLKIPKGTWIPLEDMKMFPDDQLCVLTTGSQGEPMSALVQMSKGSYGRLQIRPGDTLIYSARPIPGNEAAIWRTINRLIDQGCHVVYDHPTPVHVSGHAYQEELKMMINLTRPFYVAPVHGEPRHQALYNKMASNMGYPPHRRFTMRAGVPLEITDTSADYGEPVVAGRVLIDSGGHDGVTDEVLRDRNNIAKEGLVVITVAVDVTKGEIVGDPVMQARAFSGPTQAISKCYDVVHDALQALSREEKRDIARVRHDAGDVAKRYLLKHTGLRPLVLPVVIEV
jgi:ribonuclease J